MPTAESANGAAATIDESVQATEQTQIVRRKRRDWIFDFGILVNWSWITPGSLSVALRGSSLEPRACRIVASVNL